MFPGSMPPGITFTRASTATYTDASGVIQTVAVNQPRWDYAGGSLRGLLIEEARTNAVANSGDASNASWGKSGNIVAAPVVTGNQVTSPDGTLTASRVVFPAVSGASAISALNLTVSFVGTVAAYTMSIWARGNVGGEQTYLMFTNGAVFYRSRITLTTAWQRFSLTTANLTAANWFPAIGADFRDGSQTATPAQTIYVWGGQVEQGGFVTSYIPTTSSGVTRALEVCTIPTAGGNVKLSNNGGAPVTLGGALTQSGATRLAIGNDPWSLSSAACAWHRRVGAWPRVLADTEMQQVTT